MRWQQGRRSINVQDRRGMGRPLAYGGGAMGLVVLVLSLIFGGNGDISQGGIPYDDGQGYGGAGQAGQFSPEEEQLKEFVSVVLADTEDTWPKLLGAEGVRYVEPKLVLFSGAVESACGFQQSAVGPFYCPLDQQVYLDLSFFEDLARMGGPGDFAQAYVIAHEVGHHVQTLLGISEKVHSARRRMSETQSNALSVKMELQADCLAGVWAHHANRDRKLLEPGDLEEGLGAASAIGDDRLQKRARGHVVPESFTHGSSQDRVAWFTRGMETGNTSACDTFGR